MKLWLFILLFCCGNIQAETILVSDIDDTIKQTHVLSNIDMITRGALLDNPFEGMNGLYQQWLRNPSSAKTQIKYLTAAPMQLDNFGYEFIHNSHFPDGEFISGRGFFDDTRVFKKEKLLEISSRQPVGSQYILIGDNGEKDIFAYQDFKKYIEQKNKSLKPEEHSQVEIFIHFVYEPEVGGEEIPSSQIPFLTAADLAIHFYNRQWIQQEHLQGVLNEVYQQLKENPEGVVPDFMTCYEFVKNKKFWPQIQTPVNESIIFFNKEISKQLKEICLESGQWLPLP